MGSLVTVITICLFVFYGMIKYQVMMGFGDTSLMFSFKENFYDSDSVETDKAGFNVAFGLTYFDGSTEMVEDPDYGVL